MFKALWLKPLELNALGLNPWGLHPWGSKLWSLKTWGLKLKVHNLSLMAQRFGASALALKVLGLGGLA
jgi:hypothetical protein